MYKNLMILSAKTFQASSLFNSRLSHRALYSPCSMTPKTCHRVKSSTVMMQRPTKSVMVSISQQREFTSAYTTNTRIGLCLLVTQPPILEMSEATTPPAKTNSSPWSNKEDTGLWEIKPRENTFVLARTMKSTTLQIEIWKRKFVPFLKRTHLFVHWVIFSSSFRSHHKSFAHSLLKKSPFIG